jgi:DNA-binding transcriptional ArsR family regulator
VTAMQDTWRPDAGLGKFAAHTVRLLIFFVLGERDASVSELASLLGEERNIVENHVKVLLEYDPPAIELVREEAGKVGNTKKKIYRAIERGIEFDHSQRTPEEQRNITTAILRYCYGNIADAKGANTFDSRPDRFLVRYPGVVDDQGFKEATALGDEWLDKYEAILERSRQRLVDAPEESEIPIVAILMHFERPDRGRKS